jgi:lysine-specific metallo-endopeptidase family protein
MTTRAYAARPALEPAGSTRCSCGTGDLAHGCAACRDRAGQGGATSGGERAARGRAVAPATSAAGRGHSFGAVSVERKDGVVHGPAGGSNRFDHCPTQWRSAADAAQTLGGDWLDNVVNGLNALPSPIPPPVAALLTRHFHTTYDKDVAKIAKRFQQLGTAIKKSIDFQCETSCSRDVLAYVYSVWSDLHLCPYWFNSGPERQASTVIHELAHDVVGCDDNAYEWQTAKYRSMSVDEAIDNADSYAHFAWDASRP